ncbi:MAG: fatty acid desaturase [Pseudomonadota bacterium]
MSEVMATNAASSNIKLDKKSLKALMRRNDRAGLTWVSLWIIGLSVTGILLYGSFGTWWLVPAMILYGIVLTLPSYALSHECAHGTAFRTRWINETFFWISSLIYFEEPNHRRYAHARHHTYTWIRAKDAQITFHTPLTLKGWFMEISGLGQYLYEAKILPRNALGLFNQEIKEFTPASELPKLKWGARAFLAFYLGLAGLSIAFAWTWPLYFLLIPRLIGAPFMLLVTLIQHVEMQEDQHDITKSTRSCRTTWLGRFLYMNMNHHIEHHLYPMVPFHALPALNGAIKDQLPEPDPGFIRTNLEVVGVVIRRSLGRNTKAATIRQAASQY